MTPKTKPGMLYQSIPGKGTEGSNSSKKNIPVFLSNGKRAGYVNSGTLHKQVQGSKHFLKRPPAIANDIDLLAAAENLGAVRVVILDTETRQTYTASIEHIRQAGFRINRGFGEQIALPLSGWMMRREGQNPIVQLTLWQK